MSWLEELVMNRKTTMEGERIKLKNVIHYGIY